MDSVISESDEDFESPVKLPDWITEDQKEYTERFSVAYLLHDMATQPQIWKCMHKHIFNTLGASVREGP